MIFSRSVVPAVTIRAGCDQAKLREPVKLLPNGANGQTGAALQLADMKRFSVQAKEETKNLRFDAGGEYLSERIRLCGNTIQLCGFTIHANVLSRRVSSLEQFAKVVVNTSDAEVRFAPEWLAQVMNSMGLAIEKLDHCENEILRLVQAVHDLILRHCHGLSVGDATFHFQQPKPTCRRIAALDIVTKLFEFAIHRFKSKFSLDLHHDRSCPRGRCLCIDWRGRSR